MERRRFVDPPFTSTLPLGFHGAVFVRRRLVTLDALTFACLRPIALAEQEFFAKRPLGSSPLRLFRTTKHQILLPILWYR